MDIARRKLSSPQWWACVWQHYTANMQRHIKEDDKKKDPSPSPSSSHIVSRMIHPNNCTSPPAAAERPKMLNLQPEVHSPSLATMGSATVLDLSNPAVLNRLAENVVFTPNTEQMLLTTLNEAINAQELTAAVTPVSFTATAATATATATTTTAAASVPLMVSVEEEAPVPSPEGGSSEDACGSSEYSVSMDSMDPQVARAWRQSSDTDSLTPLIKTELKCTIQKKRIASGKSEIAPEELLAIKNNEEELTPEEEERRKRRRERNKIAAQKCRSKRKEKAEQLEEEADALEESNAEMRKIVAELEAEKEKLKRLLSFHDDQGPKCPKRQRLSEDQEEPEREEELLEVLMDSGDTFCEDMQIVIN